MAVWSTDKFWQELNLLPDKGKAFGIPLKHAKNKFIVLHQDKISEYDITSDKWQEKVKFPQKIINGDGTLQSQQTFVPIILIHNSDEILFLYHGCKLIKFNFNSKSFKPIFTFNRQYSSAIAVNNENIHLFDT